jgi:hypothetical protein
MFGLILWNGGSEGKVFLNLKLPYINNQYFGDVYFVYETFLGLNILQVAHLYVMEIIHHIQLNVE